MIKNESVESIDNQDDNNYPTKSKSITLSLSIYEPISENAKEIPVSKEEGKAGRSELKGNMKTYRLVQPISPTPSSSTSLPQSNIFTSFKDEEVIKNKYENDLKEVALSIQALRASTNQMLTDLISKNGQFESLKEKTYLKDISIDKNHRISTKKSRQTDPLVDDELEEEDVEEEEDE